MTMAAELAAEGKDVTAQMMQIAPFEPSVGFFFSLKINICICFIIMLTHWHLKKSIIHMLHV